MTISHFDKNQAVASLVENLAQATSLSAEVIDQALEKPRNQDFGDLAFPCFLLAKAWKCSPVSCAAQLSERLVLPAGVSEANAVGPFVNFRFDRKALAKETVQRIALCGSDIGRRDNSSTTVIVEYSSPNIAKPFHVGHLRTTLIGNCLDLVHRHLGFHTISINHLGDWGTQFGFVWAGCHLWGKPQNPTVHELVEIYRRATALKERQEKGQVDISEGCYPDVNEMARRFFLDLENNEAYAKEFWQWCLDISLAYLHVTYRRLGIGFDHYVGESFYSDKLEEVQEELRRSGLLSESEGALGVNLGEEDGFARIMTPDGRSLYLTRDIAAAMYRAKTFAFDKTLYVVGAPQALHFRQLKGVLKALGHEYADRIVHVAFGHVLGMKTRGEGEVVELNDFLDEAYERALQAYREQVTRRPDNVEEKEVARGVALAAIIFSNLSRARIKDVVFKWEHALEFQGDSGPYLLYACARINGIREKAFAEGLTLPEELLAEAITEDSAAQLISVLSDFDRALEKTAAESEPFYLASYALDLAKVFSRAYLDLKVIGAEKNIAEARLLLFEATRIVLQTTLRLLGIEPLERM